MNKIPSFTINHNKLLRGIYVSRKDEVGGEVITTFDIRMKVPNQEPCLHNGAIHTIEHLAATYLRNDEEWKDRIIYWGPMGCLTGNYLLIKGDLESKDIVELMKRTFKFIADFEGEIPGQAAKDCGNYLLHDLPMAKYEARKYLDEVLCCIREENLIYPTQDQKQKIWQAYHLSLPYFSLYQSCQPLTRFCHTTQAPGATAARGFRKVRVSQMPTTVFFCPNA